jgi:hypothetical protein
MAKRQIRIFASGPGSRVDIDLFLDAAASVLTVVREVGVAMLGSRAHAVTWYIDEMHASSPNMLASAEIDEDTDLSDSDIDNLLSTSSSGLVSLQNSANIPPFFTDHALTAARRLGSLTGENGVTRLEVTLGDHMLDVTNTIEAYVVEATKGKIRSVGSIEGTIEGVSVHGKKRFKLYERQSGRALDCQFDFDEHSIFDDYWRKRVLVRGEIWSRADGHPINIHVSKPEDIYSFPDDDQLPSAADVRGILRNG